MVVAVETLFDTLSAMQLRCGGAMKHDTYIQNQSVHVQYKLSSLDRPRYHLTVEVGSPAHKRGNAVPNVKRCGCFSNESPLE